MKSVNIASIIIWGKEIIQKIAVINYAINQKMKLQFNLELIWQINESLTFIFIFISDINNF